MMYYMLSISDYLSFKGLSNPIIASNTARMFTKYEKYFKSVLNDTIIPLVQRNKLNLKELNGKQYPVGIQSILNKELNESKIKLISI